MRIAYLDCFSGISGDMFLGALVDAGVPVSLLEQTVAALDLGARLEISRVHRSGITATKVDVIVHGEKDLPREEYWRERENRRRHEHLHGHSHDADSTLQGHDHSSTQQGAFAAHQHSHGTQPGRDLLPKDVQHDDVPHEDVRNDEAPHKHDDSHGHPQDHAHGRGLTEVRQIIARAPITDRAKQTANKIFQALGEAEAKIHNTSIEAIHFHEVGAVDALVDIIGAAVGAEALGVDEWVCSPLNVGGGTVKCAHGVLPVPAPATVELLKDAPVYSSGPRVELVTPTGAAIVKTLASRFASFPRLKIANTGYGAGSRDFKDHANVLRIVIGESIDETVADHADAINLPAIEGIEQDVVTVIEANLDDITPQLFAHVMDRLFTEGAVDVFATSVQMKKNRPGTLLTVLARPADAQRLTKLIFTESTTLGVRVRQERRHVLARRSVAVHTPWGDVRMKVANLNGAIANAAPEYEDCRRIAAENQIPLKRVLQEAMRLYLAGPPAEDQGPKSQNG
jgi:uncharacterized protein (TIGR00299 family) protein